MGLAEELSNPPAAKVNRCGTCKWLTTLSDEDHAAVQAALQDPRWTQVGLYRALSKNGLPVKETQFRRHYRGTCHE